MKNERHSAFRIPHSAFGRWLGPVAAGALPLVAYLATTPRHVLDGDSAVLATQAYRLGLAQPPGYPLMGLLGKLVTTCVPFGPLAWRANLVAVAASVAALVLAYGLLRRWGVPRAVAVLATWLMAFSPLFWSQSLHVNPYVVALAAAFGIVFLLDVWAQRVQSEIRNPKSEVGWLAAAAFVYGLGMGGHPSLALYLPGVALFVVLGLRGQAGAHRERWARRLLAAGAVGLAAAAAGCLAWLCYDLYYLQPQAAGPAGEAAGRGLWELLTASGTDSDWRRFFTGVAAAGYPAQLALHAARALAELSPVGAALAVVGGVALVRRRGWPLVLLVGLGYVMQMNFAATLRHWHFYDVYRLPCHAIEALLIGVGLSVVAARLGSVRARAAALAAAAFLVLGPPYAALALVPDAPRASLHALRPKTPWRAEFARQGHLDGLEALGHAAAGTIVANYGAYGTLVFLQRVEGAGAGVRLEAGFGRGGERLRLLLGEGGPSARLYAYLRHSEEQARRSLAERFELREELAGASHTLYRVRAVPQPRAAVPHQE